MRNPFKRCDYFIVQPYDQAVFIAWSIKEFDRMHRYLDKCKSGMQGDTGGVTMVATNPKNGERVFIVGWFNRKPATLAHESFHVLMKIFDYCGVEFNADNNEHFAYALSAMMNGVMGMKK